LNEPEEDKTIPLDTLVNFNDSIFKIGEQFERAKTAGSSDARKKKMGGATSTTSAGRPKSA
jgi:hypothetical protein